MRTVEIPNDILLSHVRQLIAEGHTVTIRVKGVSMRPCLENGRDSVVLAAATTIKKRDVVLAECSPGRYVLHRVIKIKGDHLTLMGDGNIKDTESCRTDNIAGVVITLIREGKPIACRSRKWKIYSGIWLTLRPGRRILLAVYRSFRKREKAYDR